MKSALIPPPVLLVLAMAACASRDRPLGEWEGSVSDSAGIAVVHNTSDALWPDGQQWTITEELTIGEMEGDPDYQFGLISGIALDAARNIYVLDAQAQNVRVFDQAGKLLRQFGKAGSGPGEIGKGGAAGIFIAHDTVLVPDLTNQRINIYATDGTSLGSHALPFDEGIPVRWAMSRGGILSQTRKFPTPGAAATDQTDRIVERNLAGELTDTVLEFPSGHTVTTSGGTPRITVFEAEPMWDAGFDGSIYLAVNDQYRIKVFSPAGELKTIITKPQERQPVTDRDRKMLIKALTDVMRRQGTPPNVVQSVLGNLSFADFYPAFTQLRAGRDGTVWVQRIRSAVELTRDPESEFDPQDLGSSEWDVFGSDGHYLGIVTMPDHFAPQYFGANALYGVWRDELDVQHVFKGRIVREET